MEMKCYKMIYKIEKNTEKLTILGKDFIKNNKNKCKLIINNKKCQLKDIILIKSIKKSNMKLVLNKNIYNKSFMFKNCVKLESLIQISNVHDIENLLNDEPMIDVNEREKNNLNNFSDTYSDTDDSDYSFSEITKKTEENSDKFEIVKIYQKLNFLMDNNIILKEMFYNCKSLKILPDLSKWNKKVIHDMSKMFFNCKSLTYLPNISCWDTCTE